MTPGDFHKYAKAKWQRVLSNKNLGKLLDDLSPQTSLTPGKTNLEATLQGLLDRKQLERAARQRLRGTMKHHAGGDFLHTGVYPTIPVPLTSNDGFSRLNSYKEWKKTGRLPRVDPGYHLSSWVNPEDLSFSGYSLPYKRSKTPLSLFHGSTQSSLPLEELLRKGHSTIVESGKSAIIPGQPGLAAGGLFSSPTITRGIARRHAAGPGGRVYKARIPRKDVLTHYKYFDPETKGGWVETLIPASAMRPRLPG